MSVDMGVFRFGLVFCVIFSSFYGSHALGRIVQEPRSIATTDNIKELLYNPDALHRHIGFYNYQSSIVFDADEVIGTISVGASAGWQFVHQANRLFLKPVEDNANTNCTILTNKRVYHFLLEAAEADGLQDPRLAYEVRFKYPDKLLETNQGAAESVGELSDDDPSMLTAGGKSGFEFNDNLNFKYRVSGSDIIKPIRVYDNGVFTYMQFPSQGGEIPAVFGVEPDGYESLVNFRMVGRDTIVLEQVGARFTLRSGDSTVCVFNDNIRFEYIKPRGKILRLF